MVRVKDILAAIDRLAPWSDALPIDHVGLQVGDPEAEVTHAFVALDRSLGVVEAAAQSGAQLILSHHPLIWTPLKDVLATDTVGLTVQKLIKHNIAIAGVHTNWDVAINGISETMAQRLGLNECVPFGTAAPGSKLPLGRLGRLPQPITLEEFTAHADACFNTVSMAWGDHSQMISKVGVVGGAGDPEWPAARALGADAFLTGEVAQHEALAATSVGMAILASGHYATEHPGCVTLRNVLAEQFPTIAWTIYEPKPGFDGRPLR